MDPTRCLTKIACRKLLRGDCNAIFRIHNFLEKVSIINYQVSLKKNNYQINNITLPATKKQSSSSLDLKINKTVFMFSNRKFCG